MQKYIKTNEFKTISRDDLLLSLKEKLVDPTPSSLASACRSKIDEILLPIRKEKKEVSRKEDLDKPDCIIILRAYPLTSEEAVELDLSEYILDIYLYMRPSLSHIHNHFRKKTEHYSQKISEISSSGGDPSTLVSPVQPDLYPGAVHVLDRFSLEKKNYKNFFVQVLEFETDEDLEFKEEIKEEKEDLKKKDVKTSARKGEENKEEEIDQNDPKIKFCTGFVEEIKNLISDRGNYDNLKKNARIVQLFPESKKIGLKESKSQVSVASSTKKSEIYEKNEVSADDLPKGWDFSYFYACLNTVTEQVCDTKFMLACGLRWLSRNSSISSLYKPSNPLNDTISIISENNQILIKAEKDKFYLSESFVTETMLKIVKTLNVPGINRFLMPKPMPEPSRKSESTSILSFSTFHSNYFERSLNILAFEKMLKKVSSERS